MKTFFYLAQNLYDFLASDREDVSLEDLAREFDPNVELSEDEFLEVFHLPPINNITEKQKRAKTLKEHQEQVLEINKAYLAGNITWFEETNEFSDLPDDEFVATYTGLIGDSEEDIDLESERFYESYRRHKRSTAPSSYSSVDLGFVSPVKSQGSCGSCAAFTTLALVETCFKKNLGVPLGDYSEQQLLDCAYGTYGIRGCDGSPNSYGYAFWLRDNQPKLASEESYPYTPSRGTCRTDYKGIDLDAEISGAYYTEEGDEETMKKLVVDHGAVYTTMHINTYFRQYKAEFSTSMSRLDPRNCCASSLMP